VADHGSPARRVRPTQRLRGAAWLAGAYLTFVVAGYGITLVLARHFGASSFGLYGVVVNLLTAANLVQTQGVPQALARAVAGGADESASWRAALRVQRGASAAGAAVLVIAAPLLATSDRRLLGALLATACVVPAFAAFGALTGLVNGRQQFRTQALIIAVYSALRAGCVVGLALAFGIYGAIAGFAVSPLATYGLFRRERPPRTGTDVPWRPLLRYAVATVGFAGAVTAMLSLDLVVVKLVVADPAATGLYAAAQNVARVPYLLLVPAGIVLFPSVADVVRGGDDERLRNLVRTGLEGAIAVVAPVVAVLAAAPEPVLRLLVGAEYAGAATTLRLLACATGLLAVAFTLGSTLGGAGLARTATAVALAALALELVLAAPLARDHGIEGAATATLVASGLAAAGLGAAAWRRIGAIVAPARLARIALAAAAAYAVAAQASGPLGALLLGAGACVAYAALVVVLHVVPPSLLRR
jgi:O-antigen/teichoic acid export membrane protein